MRAWTFTTRGPPAQVLKLRHDIPQPQSSDLKPDEVIVKVSHASIESSQASLISAIPHLTQAPWIPGLEFSGTIVANGAGLADREFQDGQEVFGMNLPKQVLKYNGSLAEYIVAAKGSLIQKPSNVTFAEASRLGGSGCTVIGIAERAGMLKVDTDGDEYKMTSLAEGNKILVTGGSTALGTTMLQLAKTLVGDKGKVISTCSPRNADAVLSYGADEIIDYTQHPRLHEYLVQHHSAQPFDAIIDITGSDSLLYQRCPAYLKTNGPFVFAGNMSRTHSIAEPGVLGALLWFFQVISLVISWQLDSIWPVFLGGVPRQSFFHSGKPNTRNFKLLTQLMEDGKINGVVDSVWDMEDVVKAFDHLKTGKTRGKVVIKVAT